jgi:serine/threonine protein kinase
MSEAQQKVETVSDTVVAVYPHHVPAWARQDVWCSSLRAWMRPWDTSALTGRYKLLEKVGSGAYGEVAFGLDAKTGSKVAIKRMRWHHPGRDESHPTRVLREVGILMSLRGHPNLLQLKDIKISTGPKLNEIYVVTEALDADMSALFEKKVVLVEHHLRWWGYKLVLALAQLHAKGIAHRDLKPENVLITERCDLVVGDFGLARAWNRPAPVEGGDAPVEGGGGGAATVAEEMRRATGTESRGSLQTQYVCSRWYRPPEAFVGRVVGPPVDIWSLGCILAELYLLVKPDAERKPLFPGRFSSHSPVGTGPGKDVSKYDQINVMRTVLGCPKPGQPQTKENTWGGKCLSEAEEKARWLARFPGVPEDLIAVMLACLQWDPSERPSAESLLSHSAFATVRNLALEKTVLAKATADGPGTALEVEGAKGDMGRQEILKTLVGRMI